ncbi:hypothetical protein KSP40_PGU013856 [Platanthera guangdongensis]|uniref:Sodium/metabolite cotransporter BASS3, chloroplastic n=1 Tax=Platanthera guangdongensis TaxID=2320717 RepID=A0ABR2M6N6_9ASPA
MAALLASKALPPLLPVGGGFRRNRSAGAAASLSLICRSPATRRRGFGNGAPVLACSTCFPFEGRAGWQRREAGASLFSSGENPAGFIDGKDRAEAISQALSAMLPFVVAATAVSALAIPSTFSWVSKEYYAPALGGIMLSIGIKLSIDDFSLAFQRQVYIPYSLFEIVKRHYYTSLHYPNSVYFVLTIVVDLCLFLCVAGAQLSSYASFLGKGDVALSILLTSITTISSVVVTPILTGLLIGSVVPVNAVAMSKSILQVVLVPVITGLLLNTYAKPVVNVIRPVMPFVAMFCTSLCIGSPLAINRGCILSPEGLLLLLPVVAFHLAAFALGYWASKTFLRKESHVTKELSFCKEMQNLTFWGLLGIYFLKSKSQNVRPNISLIQIACIWLNSPSFNGSPLRVCRLPNSSAMTWEQFKNALMEKFLSSVERDKLAERFLYLQQPGRTVTE